MWYYNQGYHFTKTVHFWLYCQIFSKFFNYIIINWCLYHRYSSSSLVVYHLRAFKIGKVTPQQVKCACLNSWVDVTVFQPPCWDNFNKNSLWIVYRSQSCTSRIKKKAINCYNNDVHRHLSRKKNLKSDVTSCSDKANDLELFFWGGGLKLYVNDDNKKNQNLPLIWTPL